MAIGTWDPSANRPAGITDNFDIGAYLTLANAVNANPKTLLGTEQITNLTRLINCDIPFWEDICVNLDTDQIMQLMRLFILTEEQYSELHAGKKSPVIALNQILKKRQIHLSKEFLLWIKENSTNRYLPNGSIF